MFKVLMVCMGNICRSPIAEAVARTVAVKAGVARQIQFDSAGTHAFHAGEAPDGRAQLVAKRRGYDLSRQRARVVVDADYERFDLILAMDRQNLDALKRRVPTVCRAKVELFMAYAEGFDTDEVPDPYYGSLAGFERVLDMCEAAAQGLITSVASSVVFPGDF